jgi:hypothetical protein
MVGSSLTSVDQAQFEKLALSGAPSLVQNTLFETLLVRLCTGVSISLLALKSIISSNELMQVF